MVPHVHTAFFTGHLQSICKEILAGAGIKKFQVWYLVPRLLGYVKNEECPFVCLSSFLYAMSPLRFVYFFPNPGEDPFLTSQYSKAFVQALQGTNFEDNIDGKDDSDIYMAACCKHFIGNSLEHWNDFDRHSFDAKIDDYDLNNYYLPPFEECAKHAVGVMCSYNALNGVPTCANDWLLKDVLRDRMNFTGYIVTDCGALSGVTHGHHYAIDDTQASVSIMRQ